MIKWVFLDLGWTLVDEIEAHRDRWNQVSAMMAGWGMPYPVDELIELSEKAATNFAESPFQTVLGSLGLSDRQREDILTKISWRIDLFCLYPGVELVLEELSKHYKLGIIANQSAGTEERLKKWGIHKYFSLIISSAEEGLVKPDPGIFGIALDRADCMPDEVILVGDRLENDLGPAKKLGWRTIRIRQGFHRFQVPRTKEEEPDLIIDTVADIPQAVYQLVRNS